MKAIGLIVAMSLLPFLMFSQRGNGKENRHHRKTKHDKESFVYITSFYGPPKLVYITKKNKLESSWAPPIGFKRHTPPALMKDVGLSLARKAELNNEEEQPQVYFDKHSSLYPSIP